jgi:UDP-glucose 4-epimerase
MDKGEGQIYNLGCGEGTSINELFAIMKSITGYPREPVQGPPKPGETFRIYLDAGKARRELGWKPLVGLEEGLGSTIDFFLNAR